MSRIFASKLEDEGIEPGTFFRHENNGSMLLVLEVLFCGIYVCDVVGITSLGNIQEERIYSRMSPWYIVKLSSYKT